MKKSPKSSKPKVFFNASVILAGLKSPRGGSAKVIRWAKSGKIQGFISEIIFDEVMRRSPKINWRPQITAKVIVPIFTASAAPASKLVKEYSRTVTDLGDSHVLASARELNCDYLVSLDKKHLLALASKVKPFRIVTPGQLIKTLAK